MISTRRTFLGLIAAGGGALVLGIRVDAAADDQSEVPFEPNAWLRVESDGTIVLRVGKTEMGQGVRTSLPMILAEEMDADFDTVRIEQASPGPDFQRLGTGGSGSIMRSWDSLREAGATARAMLIAAACERWKVSAESCETLASTVHHRPSKRSLTYGELAAAAARQPLPSSPQLKKPSAYRLLGRPTKRLDGPAIVEGKATYGIDVRTPGMKFAVIARPPRLGSKLSSVDSSAARKVSGVREIFEIPEGVAVVADNTWAALRGREALEIVWTDGRGASFDSSKHEAALVKATESPGISIRRDKEGRAAMKAAARIMESLYLYPFEAHASVEPVNSTVHLEAGRCTIWSPTQTPNSVSRAASQLLELPESAITVNVTLLGGGFGRRLGVDFDVEAIRIARKMPGTPIHLFWSREDDLRHGYFQAASAHRLRAGLDDHGSIVAFEHRKASTPHNARSVPSDEERNNPDVVRGWAWGVYDSPYYFPAAEMSYAVVDAPVPIGPWRAVFSPSSVFARECFLDEVAESTGRDPLALRLELLGAGNPSIPSNYTIEEETIDRPRLRKVLETVAARSGWSAPPPPGTARGLACNFFHTGTYIAYVVEVSRRANAASDQLPFVVRKVFCAIDCGTVINPLGVRQQVESGVIWSLSNMKGAITFLNGAAEQSNFGDFPVVMIHESPPSIDTRIVDSGDERPHGIGEPTVCPFAPAVTNALSRLIGKRIRRLPVRSDDLT